MIPRLRFSLALLAFLASSLSVAAQTAPSDRPAIAANFLVAPTEVADPGGCSGALLASASDSSAHGFDLSNLDRSVSPCDDFYEFANGGWIKAHPIPADHPSLGRFNQLQDHNEDVLRQILDQAAADKHAAPGSNWQKIGDFYASCMDTSAIESADVKPLDPELQRIASLQDTVGLQDEIARLQRDGVSAVFDFGSEQDPKDSTQEIAGARQGGLGLPDRQYYLDDDDRSKQLRAAYLQHVTNMFKLMGDDGATAAAEAKTVLDIETSLAISSMNLVDLRDPDKTHHKMALDQLADLTPDFAWQDYLKEVGASPVSAVDIRQPDFFKQVNSALVLIPLADWKIYLRWHLIHTVATALPEKFVEENSDFYGHMLRGTEEIPPRWRRCVEATDSELGEALGQYYVQRNFPPEAKTKAIAMVNNIKAALHDDLETLDWMSPATRQQALAKLAAMNLKIGYPDKWRDYSAYQVTRGPYVENYLRGNTFEFARDLAKVGKPVDRTEWHMTPPTVDAYYSSQMNEIVFPAGILQPPFFDPQADDAINYGGIGATIGHEMTHGFDDQGAKFDAQGNLNNWWTPGDLKNFQARGACIIKQFDAYEAEGLHENGELVEGESIADLGGVTLSHRAFEKTLEGKPAPPPIDGFTEEQRFFLGFAQIWAGSYRPEAARLRIKTNPHPLPQFRTDGPLSSTPGFAAAFGCKPDSPMIRPEDLRCRIW
jgi:putative endopeptidase